MFKKIKDFFLGIFAKPLIEKGEVALEDWLRRMIKKQPRLFKLLIITNYAAAKEYGPELVASTETDLDDKALAEFLEALETVAVENGIDLHFEVDGLKEEPPVV